MIDTSTKRNRSGRRNKINNSNWQFWAIIAVPVLYAFVFAYIPMGGILLAFKDYSFRKGILGSDWVGLTYIKQFLTSPSSKTVILNTLALGVYSLVVLFPIPIFLAIGLNEIKCVRYKKFIQMITYAPYFISTVVLVGMMMQIMDLRSGILNLLLQKIGVKPINFFGEESLFRSVYVWSGLWQTAGYSAVLYIASLAGVNPELKEAAICDGASRLQRIHHVDIPSIMPTIITMLIFNCGSVMSIGFDKAYLMQNSLNAGKSEVIATFVYKVGLMNSDFGFATAAGLFQSVISFSLLVIVNWICKKVTQTSLW